MADTKPSAFTTDSAPDDTDVIPYIDLDGGGAGVHLPRKLTFTDLTTYIESRGRVNNASTAQQTWAAAEAYLVGSSCLIPVGRLQAKSKWICRFYVAKTSAAGTATPIINIKIGTAGTTADTTRATLTFAAQTAVADEGRIDLEVTFRSVGAASAAVIRAQGTLDHRLASTGLANVNTSIVGNTSTGFDSTTSGLIIGASVTWGTSFVGTTDLVQAELMNLA